MGKLLKGENLLPPGNENELSQPNSTHSLESISLNISNLGQLDGNVSFETTTIGKPITVHVSERQKF